MFPKMLQDFESTYYYTYRCMASVITTITHIPLRQNCQQHQNFVVHGDM